MRLVSSRLVASLTPVVAVGLAMACQGNPPVHTGDGLLEFGTTTTVSTGGGPPVVRTTRLSLYQAAPFDHWGYRASALVGYTDNTGNPLPWDLTTVPLDPTHEPFMRYTSSAPFWLHIPQVGGVGVLLDLHDQHEIDLFARDPAEQAATVRALPFDAKCAGGACGFTSHSCNTDDDCSDINIAADNWLGAWEHEWELARNPVVPRMMYPPQPNLTTVSIVNAQIAVSNPLDLIPAVYPGEFWFGTPAGPGAAPNGFGSIKAVKVINHGVCGAFQSYAAAGGSGLLQIFADRFPKFVLPATGGNNYTCNTLEQLFLSTAPYLDFTTDEEDAQNGGFILGTHLQIKDPLTQGGPNFLLVFKEQWHLFDGRLTTQGEVLDLHGQGTRVDDVRLAFPPPLTREMDAPLPPGAAPTTIAEAIWSIAYGLQRFNGIPQLQGGPFMTCAPRPDGRVIRSTTPPDPCAAFVNTYASKVQDGISGYGASFLGLNGDEQTEVSNEFEATEVVGPNTVWKNFRCADLGDVYPQGHPLEGQAVGPVCYYELPAKRLNVYPDGVELVFLDQLKELENPVYPIWLMLLQFETSGQATTLSPLCDDATAQTAGYLNPQRSFRPAAAAFHATYNCHGPATDCGLASDEFTCCCDVITVTP